MKKYATAQSSSGYSEYRQITSGRFTCVYEQFAACYSGGDIEKYNFIRVDSSMVSNTSSRMAEGMGNIRAGNWLSNSTAFDGIPPCGVSLFTEPTYCCEGNALSLIVLKHVKQQADHRNIYVMDRGLQSTRNMKAFSEKAIGFVARVKENRKCVDIKCISLNYNDFVSLKIVHQTRFLCMRGLL